MSKFAKETNVPEHMAKKKTNPAPADYAALQTEIARPKKEFRQEMMCADVYLTMFDVAEEMFHILLTLRIGKHAREPNYIEFCKEPRSFSCACEGPLSYKSLSISFISVFQLDKTLSVHIVHILVVLILIHNFASEN